MTCYLYRDADRLLIGPFPSPEAAFVYRERIRKLLQRRMGRPKHVGAIISAEEAIKLVIHAPVTRTTPDRYAVAVDTGFGTEKVA